jgi:hypothetical protein
LPRQKKGEHKTDKTKAKAAKALADMLDARRVLATVQNQLDREADTAAPGSQAEKEALQMTRFMRHLSDAVADIPTVIWCAMIKSEDISLEDLRKQLNAA